MLPDQFACPKQKGAREQVDIAESRFVAIALELKPQHGQGHPRIEKGKPGHAPDAEETEEFELGIGDVGGPGPALGKKFPAYFDGALVNKINGRETGHLFLKLAQLIDGVFAEGAAQVAQEMEYEHVFRFQQFGQAGCGQALTFQWLGVLPDEFIVYFHAGAYLWAMRSKQKIAWGGLLVVLGLLVACENPYRRLAREAPFLSVGARDATGTFVSLPDQPRRIIALDPAAAELLVLFGRADRVVAVSEFCDGPPELNALPTLFIEADSGYRVQSFEALKADLVFHSLSLARPERFRAFAQGLGLPVFFGGVQSWEQVEDQIQGLGRLAACDSQAQAYVRELNRFIGAIAAARPTGDTVRTVVLTGTRPLRVLGRDHYLTGLLTRLGARNVMDFLAGETAAASGELIAGQRPALVLVLSDNAADATLDLQAKAPELGDTPAGHRSEGIVSVEPKVLLRPGAGLFEAVGLLGQYLYPELAIDSLYRQAVQPRPGARP